VQDYTAATALLESLVTQEQQRREGGGGGGGGGGERRTSLSSSELRSALGRVYLQAGQLDQAKRHFEAVAAAAASATTADDDDDDDDDRDDDDDDKVVAVVVPETTKALNAAFMASACGEWDTASTILRGLVDSLTQKVDNDNHNHNTYYAVSFFPSLFFF
jgi:hypothetical protein